MTEEQSVDGSSDASGVVDDQETPTSDAVAVLQPGIIVAGGTGLDLLFETRIVGGRSVSMSYAPWRVALITPLAPNDFQGQFCGESIISTL